MCLNQLPIEVSNARSYRRTSMAAILLHPSIAIDSNPAQVLEMIGGCIEDDEDLVSYMLVCRQTNGAVNWPQSAVWRRRYVKLYDLPDGLNARQVAAKYKQLADMEEPMSTFMQRLPSQRPGFYMVRQPKAENLVVLIQGKISELVEALPFVFEPVPFAVEAVLLAFETASFAIEGTSLAFEIISMSC